MMMFDGVNILAINLFDRLPYKHRYE